MLLEIRWTAALLCCWIIVRLAQMQTAVTSLRAILEIVEREPSAMAEVQLRLTAKKPAQKVLSLKRGRSN